MSGLRFSFCEGPWENSDLPSICRENPTGGDYHVLCQMKRVYAPDDLHELCRTANAAADLLAASLAVIDRWESPLWKEAEPTGVFIYRLRDAAACLSEVIGKPAA
jgi:hypothetical protein